MPNRIKADSASGLQLISDSSDEIQIQSGTDTVATVNSSGITMGSGKNLTADVTPSTVVAFDVHNGSAQSVSHGTWTKIALDTETYDTNSNFDSTTNYRFTPTVAGYYQINGVVRFSTVTQLYICSLYKNGSQLKSGGRNQVTNTVEQNVTLSTLVYMNGSTDYIELYAYQSSGSSRNVSAGPILTYFNGILIARA